LKRKRKGVKNYKVGDIVRIPKHKAQFSKEIIGNWTIELFKISKVLNTTPPTYHIEDLKGEMIDGGFYENELQIVPKSVLNSPFRIETQLKKRIKNKRKEVFVQYLGYPPKLNEWIAEKIF
jgi:hypothetical protein